MTKKKGKFTTFFWSLIPGAGEMYLGFFKQGISIMAAFFILLGISGFLQLGFLAFLSPIVWFYSFFHTNNLNSMNDEEFYAMEDDYLLHWSDITRNQGLLIKYKKLLAVCLVFFGISILWNNFSSLFFSYLLPYFYLSDGIENALYYIFHTIPQGVVAVAIIAAGIYLLKNKRDELKNKDQEIPGPPYLEKKESQ